MTPIQQILLGTSSGSKTYGDEIFSTYVYKGNSSTQSIDNGIDLSGEGGLTWIKARNDSTNHFLYDTARGAGVQINADSNTDQHTDTTRFSSFNSNGFSLANNNYTNSSSYDYSSLSFRKAKGFFDVVNYTGNGSSQTVSHSLGSIPGVIMIKNCSQPTDWVVYHCHGGVAQAVDGDYAYYTRLSQTNAEFNSTNTITSRPTATSFTVGGNSDVNQNSNSYIAYIFAGGVSTASTARSVDFGGSSDYLSIPDDDAWELGTTFTIEAWIRPDNLDNNYNTIVAQDSSWYFSVLGGGGGNHGKLQFSGHGSTITTPFQYQIETKAWTHVAFVSNSGSGQWYVNGTATGSSTSGVNQGSSSGNLYISNQTSSSWPLDGKISNVRIVKGTAVYTSSFRVPTEPLSNITNTVLLCCNDSSVTGSTVTPGTITSSGSPSASYWNPFDDPAGYKFGEGGDQNMIKTGVYLGRGTTLNPEIHLGWEPQFLMIKALTSAADWLMYDCIRGIFTDAGNSPYIAANSTDAEVTSTQYIQLTPTGFEIEGNFADVNTSFESYAYIAIRRADGWVSKPADAGTDVFTMATGNSSNTEAFTSNFPVDFALTKEPGNTGDWGANARLIQTRNLVPNNTTTETTWSAYTFDSNTGWLTNNAYTSAWQSWMWKRGPGFDVVAYEGNSQSS